MCECLKQNFVELFNFFTNHHPIRHLCTIFRVLFVYESNAHRAISSKNDLNQTMTTHNDTTTNHSKNISTTHQRRIPQQGTIQQHTEPCIQQHIQQHTEQSTYQTTYQITYEQHTIHHSYNKPNTKQQSTSGLSDNLPKDLTNLSNNMTNRTACKAYNNQPLGATKSSSHK